MNLKERGITIGDLLVVLIIVVISMFLFKKLNNKQSSLNKVNAELISLKTINLPRNI